jgi:hypothetical protein
MPQAFRGQLQRGLEEGWWWRESCGLRQSTAEVLGDRFSVARFQANSKRLLRQGSRVSVQRRFRTLPRYRGIYVTAPPQKTSSNFAFVAFMSLILKPGPRSSDFAFHHLYRRFKLLVHACHLLDCPLSPGGGP